VGERRSYTENPNSSYSSRLRRSKKYMIYRRWLAKLVNPVGPD